MLDKIHQPYPRPSNQGLQELPQISLENSDEGTTKFMALGKPSEVYL